MTGYTGWRPMPPGRYRSRGESRIAAALDRSSMTYRYEPRLVLSGGISDQPFGRTEYWVRPDFYLPDQHSVIEYAGRMDLSEYRERHAEKTRLYERNGIECYTVYPHDLDRPYWEPRLLESILASSSSTNTQSARDYKSLLPSSITDPYSPRITYPNRKLY